MDVAESLEWMGLRVPGILIGLLFSWKLGVFHHVRLRVWIPQLNAWISLRFNDDDYALDAC